MILSPWSFVSRWFAPLVEISRQNRWKIRLRMQINGEHHARERRTHFISIFTSNLDWRCKLTKIKTQRFKVTKIKDAMQKCTFTFLLFFNENKGTPKKTNPNSVYDKFPSIFPMDLERFLWLVRQLLTIKAFHSLFLLHIKKGWLFCRVRRPIYPFCGSPNREIIRTQTSKSWTTSDSYHYEVGPDKTATLESILNLPQVGKNKP